jgi:hypothetical protein
MRYSNTYGLKGLGYTTLNDCGCSDTTLSGINKNIDDVVDAINDKYDIWVVAIERKDHIIIDSLDLMDEKRNVGLEEKVIKKVMRYAKNQNKQVFVNPRTPFFYGGKINSSRFWKSLGFVDNKYRFKDRYTFVYIP